MIVANNVQKLRWSAKSLNLNHIDHLLDILKRKVCAQQLNLRELTRVIYHMCAAIPQQYIHRHILSMSCTLLYVRNEVDVQSIDTKLNTKKFGFAVFVLRLSMSTL